MGQYVRCHLGRRSPLDEGTALRARHARLLLESANASACGLPHRLTTRATGGGGAARRGEASSSSRRCRLGGGAGEADAAREREPSMPFPNACESNDFGDQEWVSSFRLSISIQKRRYKLQCTRDSYNSQVLCELGSDLGSI
uniref:Uncharacterized protein n=1 Tax=Oryza rufipogon TaxID=4529 RepID=A0A0E0QC39_ORYRU